MIGTIDTKQQQLERGYYEFGNGNTKVLILGTCRSIPYLNYFHRWNEGRNEFTVRFIDAFNWNWDRNENRVDCEAAINSQEKNEAMLSMLKETNIFIHEHYQNFGMFNTTDVAPKNIYQFGLKPDIDVCVPNWHDVFILENDFRAFGELPSNYIEKGEQAAHNFANKCILTSFPEFGNVFKETWRDIRYFWTPNHISNHFSVLVFTLMNEKFLRMPLTFDFWNGARQEDLFKEPHTQVTQGDIEGYKLKWS
jgi:hypothetical protein